MTETIADKTRALRKYEAGFVEVASDPAEPRMAFLSPFGPLIAHMRVPATLLAHLNGYADQSIRAHDRREFIVPADVAAAGGPPSLAELIQQAARRYVLGCEQTMPVDIVIDRIWIVSQYANTPSPVHFHSGDLSGVLYLKAPDHEPEPKELQKNYISGRKAGYINFLVGGKQPYSKSLISFPPDVGDFYIFPAWLLHGAEPFLGAGERRSLSFNARVTTGQD